MKHLSPMTNLILSTVKEEICV